MCKPACPPPPAAACLTSRQACLLQLLPQRLEVCHKLQHPAPVGLGPVGSVSNGRNIRQHLPARPSCSMGACCCSCSWKLCTHHLQQAWRAAVAAGGVATVCCTRAQILKYAGQMDVERCSVLRVCKDYAQPAPAIPASVAAASNTALTTPAEARG